MNCFLPLDWTSFVLKTTCESSSRSKRPYLVLKKIKSEIKLFRMARSYSTSTTSWGPAFPKWHMASSARSDTTQVTQTTYHGLTKCTPLIMGTSGSRDVSKSSYPKLFDPFSWRYAIKKLLFFFCRIPKFRRRWKSDSLIVVFSVLQLVSDLLIFLFGVTVETLRLQCGKMLIEVRVISQSFI